MRGQKPREYNCYVFILTDESRIEIRKDLFLSWYHHSDSKTAWGPEGSASRTCLYPASAGSQSPFPGIEKKLRKLQKMLEQFSEEEKYMIYLLYFKNQTVKDTAQLLGLGRGKMDRKAKLIQRKLQYAMRMTGVREFYSRFY